MDKIGLIAGNGKFPLVFAKMAKKEGATIIAIAIYEETEKALENLVDKTYWINVGQLKTLFEILKKEDIKKTVMVGQIRHRLLFSNIEMDEELKLLFSQLKDKRTDSILGAIALRLKQLGIRLLDSTTFLKDYLPQKGVLTKEEPSAAQWEDIQFGLGMAKTIAGLDIGQTVVVKDKVVLAVEAIEGTDEAIRRASIYGKGQVVVVKVSKPQQDMRFDIPIVGKNTVEVLCKEKVAVLAIEAEKTLLLDKDFVLEQANKNNIVIVAI